LPRRAAQQLLKLITQLLEPPKFEIKFGMVLSGEIYHFPTWVLFSPRLIEPSRRLI
jgi:hypothetical protein